MDQYRVFIKDCLNLGGVSKFNTICRSFDVRHDLISKATSTFVLEEVDKEVDAGDMLGLYDSYGTVYFIGVIDKIDADSKKVSCTSANSYFSYTWIYDALRDETGSTEELIAKSFNKVFKNTSDRLMNAKYGDISVQTITQTKNLQLPLMEENAVEDFEAFIYDCYSNFNIICNFNIYFGAEMPKFTIDSSAIDLIPIKIGDNFNAIKNFKVTTDTFENNKLTIYNSDGTQLRGTYYGTTEGITQDDTSEKRLKKINNVIVFSDDELDLVVAQNLSDTMYNHQISFDLMLENNLYDFFDIFKLGCPIEIYYDGELYNSIFTGYDYKKSENENVSTVSITCGKVRNSLTSKILRYVK